MERFVESAIIDPKFPRKVEVESSSLREKVLSAFEKNHLQENAAPAFTAWEVPISAYDVDNANGRFYPRALWENVINKQRHIWEGSPMLTDHPAGDADGTPANICGVWVDGRVGDDGFVYGTVVPSGRLGEDLQDHLAKGLKAGTSSSGFGELMHDKKTVNPATYLIERLSDWVLTPSQGTYFKYDSSKKEAKNASDSGQRVVESADKQESVVREKTTVSKITRLEEKRIRKDIESFLENASTLTNPQERLAELQDIYESVEDGVCPDLRERVIQKINEEKETINKIILESQKIKESLGVDSAEALQEKINAANTAIEESKEAAQDWKAIAKNLQEKLDATRSEVEAAPSQAYVSYLKGKISSLYSENKDLKKTIDSNKKTFTEKMRKSSIVAESVDKEIQTIKLSSAKALKEKEEEIAKLEGMVERLQIRASEAESREQEILNTYREYKANQEAIPVLDDPSKRVREAVSFQETDKVNGYWADLVSRHGIKEMKMYESRIKACKTVREASSLYMKILPTLGSSSEYNRARIPESIGIELEERRALLEKAGMKFDEKSSFTKRLPEGWV